MTWINEENLKPEHIGFVYLITEIDTGMKYYGLKQQWKVKKRPALKGKTKKEQNKRKKLKGNKRHITMESDWRTYNSSCKELKAKIDKNPNNYIKVILKCCYTKTEMKAWEAYYQLEQYLFGNWSKVYNQMINLRLRIK